MPSARSAIARSGASGRPGTSSASSSWIDGVGQRLEPERDEVPPTRAPGGPMLEQLGTRQRDHEDRHAAAPLDEVVDEVERAGVGPMEVLEDQDDGALGGDPLEERPPAENSSSRAIGVAVSTARAARAAPVRSSAAPTRPAPSARPPRATFARVVGSSSVSARPARLRTISPSAQNVMPSPYAGRAAGVPPHGLDDAVEVLRQLPDEPALARPGEPDDRHDPRPPLASRGVEQVLEQRELAVAADERRLELVAPAAAAALGDDADRAVGRDRALLALEDLVAGRFEGDRLVRGALRRLADEDGPGLGDGLEPGRPC